MYYHRLVITCPAHNLDRANFGGWRRRREAMRVAAKFQKQAKGWSVVSTQKVWGAA